MVTTGLDQVLFNLGAHLAEQLTAGFNAALLKSSLVGEGAPGLRGFPTSASAGRVNPCLVQGCGDQAKSRGLCGKHYQKAIRNRLNDRTLTPADLTFLAQDGRAVRFQDAASKARAVKAGTRSSGARCVVPGCGGGVASKRLCPKHYQKSRRAGMSGRLTAEQLDVLAQDGRALRFAKPAKALKAPKATRKS